jgi:metal-sulfur cluster biosynthetic enzyme
MVDTEKILQDVINSLKKVVDPETGSNVVKMRLVLNLQIDEDGTVAYIFRPSSPLCPIALPLVMDIIEAVKVVEGVTDQKVTVENYSGADELNAILASLPLGKK